MSIQESLAWIVFSTSCPCSRPAAEKRPMVDFTGENNRPGRRDAPPRAPKPRAAPKPAALADAKIMPRAVPQQPLVVGIGASAGGLDAFKAFFFNMPADSGMAFVLVQHLDPRHKSLLAELIGRQTPMPVIQAEDGLEVAADRVYVIPPDATLTINGGVLRLERPAPARQNRFPIDAFFSSLGRGSGGKRHLHRAVGDRQRRGSGAEEGQGARRPHLRPGRARPAGDDRHARERRRHRPGRPHHAGAGHAGRVDRLPKALP